MSLTDFFASITSAVALVTAAVTYWQVCELRRQTQADRNIRNESQLVEWPAALELYGIDLKTAARDLGKSKRSTVEQIAYLVSAVNALTALFDNVHEAHEGVPSQQVLAALLSDAPQGAYWRELFSQQATRSVWKYSKRCISPHWRAEIDEYVRRKYPTDESLRDRSAPFVD